MEIWKDVIGYEGVYAVSNLGNVKSLNYRGTKKEKNLILNINSNQRLCVILYKNGTYKNRTVHQLVAESFLAHTPCGYELVVNHIDFNKQNNRLENLEIITNRENTNQKHKQSSSKFTGVSWNKNRKKWNASIRIKEKTIYLGSFDNEKEASEYYENALNAYLNNDKILVKTHLFTSKYKGVSWYKTTCSWRAQIKINGKVKHIGKFKNEIEAHEAYQKELSIINNNS